MDTGGRRVAKEGYGTQSEARLVRGRGPFLQPVSPTAITRRPASMDEAPPDNSAVAENARRIALGLPAASSAWADALSRASYDRREDAYRAATSEAKELRSKLRDEELAASKQHAALQRAEGELALLRNVVSGMQSSASQSRLAGGERESGS